MAMANAGNLPTGISFVRFSKPTSNVFTVAHELGDVPDMVMIFPESFDLANGAGVSNPLMLFANLGTPQASGYAGRLVCNYLLATGDWDYSANSAYGWSADSTNVEIKVGGNTPPFPNAANTWYMLSVKFKT